MAVEMLADYDKLGASGEGAELIKVCKEYSDKIKGTELGKVLGDPKDINTDDDIDEPDNDMSNDMDATEGDTVDLGLPTETAEPGSFDQLPDAGHIMTGGVGVEDEQSEDTDESEESEDEEDTDESEDEEDK